MTCDIVKANFPAAESKWVAAHLPVQFQIESDRFPQNRIDSIDTVVTVEAGSGGLALFTLAGTYEVYEVGEYVQITNSSLGAYNGVWRILEALYADQLLLEVAFLGDAAAELQRYYRNYAIRVDVWAGIPTTHPLGSRRPIEKKTSEPLLYRPRVDNIAYVDISDFVRADLPNIDNTLCESSVEVSDVNKPATDLWTSFYIGYSEVWDIVDSEGNAIQTNTNTILVGADILRDGIFRLGSGTTFSEWQQVTTVESPATSSFLQRVFNPFALTVPLAGILRPSEIGASWVGAYSNYLRQTGVPTEVGKVYEVSVTAIKIAPFTAGDSDFLNLYDLTNGIIGAGRILIGSLELNQFGTFTATFRFTATNNNMSFGFNFLVGDANSSSLNVEQVSIREITEIVIDPNDPNPAETLTTEIFYATQSTQQFQYVFGNSMGEYSAPFTDGAFFGKFMTLFNEPVLFEGYPLDLAIILPDNEPYPADILHWEALDRNRELIDSGQIPFNYYGEGVYRFVVSDIPYPDSAAFLTVELEGAFGVVSETKTIRIDRSVCRNGVFLTWLNYLGGWDSWLFTGYQDFSIEIGNTQQTKRNIFNIWDNRFVNGSTQSDFVQIQSTEQRTVRSQYLSEAEIDAIRWIKQSIKVQELSKTRNCTEATRRTVLVDKSGFTWKTSARRLREFEFTYRYTDDTQTQTQ